MGAISTKMELNKQNRKSQDQQGSSTLSLAEIYCEACQHRKENVLHLFQIYL